MDIESGNVNVQERRGIFSVNTPVQYPFLIVSNTVNRHNPIVSQLANIQFLFVSELDVGLIPEGIRFTPLIFTSDNSGSIVGPFFNINIQQFMDRGFINRLTEKGKVITGMYEGMFFSYFNEQGIRFANDFIDHTEFARIIVVPDMEFINSQGSGQNQNNINFLMNAVDYLNGNPGLIALRSREVINKPLLIDRLVKTEDLTPEGAERRRTNMREFVKYLNIVLPALLIVLYGLLRYKMEMNRRRRIKDSYE
jgi:hypothetical protein